MTHRLVALLVTVLLGWAVTSGAAPASAVDQGKGTPGYCVDGTGVTVVVDFGRLGGQPIVRCYPASTPGTGLDALRGAGFQIAGVQRWGDAFICRIEDRPSAVEQLPISGNEGYRERCIDTPPASGYWSYWHAGNNCAWDYSQWGVKNRSFLSGGFEGWSFSLNASSDTNPQPRVAASRPGTSGAACGARAEPSPTSHEPDAVQPAPAKAAKATEAATPKEKEKPPSETAVEFSDGTAEPDVSTAPARQSSASSAAPWVAAGAVGLMAALTLIAARRRRAGGR